MAQKLHRGRTHVFHKKKKAPLKAVCWVLAAALLVTGGYFGAKFLLEGKDKGPDIAPSSGAGPASSAPSADGSKPADTPAPPSVPEKGEALRAVYLPFAALRDGERLEATLDSASDAGFNAVLFDVKGEDGKVLYASATEAAAQAQSVDSGAMPLDTLKSLFQTMKSKGFSPIPRVYAFRDPLAPRRLSAAKIGLSSNPGWTWYDGDPKNGGKPWLNPYADAAHAYLIDLLAELKAAGADAVMLDGVEFPKYLGSAGLTAEQLTAASKAQALSAFIAKARQAMGETAVLLSSPGLAALGADTGLYGGNPVTFGATGSAPLLLPSTLGKSLSFGESKVEDPASHPYEAVKTALSQIQTRLQVIGQDTRPFLMPWLQGYDYGAADVKAQIRAVVETVGEKASYILYHPDGVYDFGALRG